MNPPLLNLFGYLSLWPEGFSCRRVELVGHGWDSLDPKEARALDFFVQKHTRKMGRKNFAEAPFVLHTSGRFCDVEITGQQVWGKLLLPRGRELTPGLQLNPERLELVDPAGPVVEPCMIFWGDGQAAMLVPREGFTGGMLLAIGSVVDKAFKCTQGLLARSGWWSQVDRGEGGFWLSRALDGAKKAGVAASLVRFGMTLRSHHPVTAIGKRLRFEHQIASRPEPTRERLREWASTVSPLTIWSALQLAMRWCDNANDETPKGPQQWAALLHRREDVACVLAALEALCVGRESAHRALHTWIHQAQWLQALHRLTLQLRDRLAFFDVQIVKLLPDEAAGETVMVKSDRLLGLFGGVHAAPYAGFLAVQPQAVVPRRSAKSRLESLYDRLEMALFSDQFGTKWVHALATESGNTTHQELYEKLAELGPEQWRERFARVHTLNVSNAMLLQLGEHRLAQGICDLIVDTGLVYQIQQMEAAKVRANTRARVRGYRSSEAPAKGGLFDLAALLNPVERATLLRLQTENQ